MGAISVTAPQSFGWLAGSSLYGGIISGFNSASYGDQVNYYAGATLTTPVTGLKFGVAVDYLSNPKRAFNVVNAVENAINGNNNLAIYQAIQDQWAVGVYGSYQVTEKLTLLARGDHLDQYSGNGNLYSVTTTVQYDLWKNVLSRLEFRWDHAEHGDAFGGTPTTIANAFNSSSLLSALDPVPTRANAFLLAANLIYKF